MTLYIFIAVVLIAFIAFGIWAAKTQKKRIKQQEDFFESAPVKAMLDSGFQKDVNGIYGRLKDYDVGLYVWFDPGNTRYFTFINCELPGSFSFSNKFYNTYRSEQIDKEGDTTIRRELKQIDGDILAKSFARLLEIVSTENFKPRPPRPPGQLREY